MLPVASVAVPVGEGPITLTMRPDASSGCGGGLDYAKSAHLAAEILRCRDRA